MFRFLIRSVSAVKCGLAVAALLLLPHGADGAQSAHAWLDPNASLIREQYALPASADSTTLLAAVELLKAAGRTSDAALLHRYVQRRVLKGLLGEPLSATDTVRMAIAREKAMQGDAEQISLLLSRVLALVVTQSAEARGDELAKEDPETLGKPIDYLGHSTWVQHHYSRETYYYRLQLENKSSESISGVFSILETTLDGRTFSLTCSIADAHRPVAPGVRAALLCQWQGDRDQGTQVVDALRRGDGLLTIYRVDFVDSGVSVNQRRVQFRDDKSHIVLARKRIRESDCTALGTCMQELKHKILNPPRALLFTAGFAAVFALLTMLFYRFPALVEGPMQAGELEKRTVLVPFLVVTVLLASFLDAVLIAQIHHTSIGENPLGLVILALYVAAVQFVAAVFLVIQMFRHRSQRTILVWFSLFSAVAAHLALLDMFMRY